MRRRRNLLATLVLFLALAALALQGASTPHVHKSTGPGLFNQEHDLTSFAAFHSGAPVPDAVLSFGVPVVVVTLVFIGFVRPPASPGRHTDSRAPPIFPA
jgi:hypothetical protein